tara:strand:+ start:1072 stop:1686 length:615 start_codon:yes stop_codon:yes gene_type:complete
MKKKFKILSEDTVNNLIEFLDEIQFDAAADDDKESLHKVNFCSWAISELLNSYDGYLRETPKKKSRDDYVDETFMDWNLPEMSDEEYEKLVDQFDAFLRSWEKEYNKKNPKNKIKRESKFKPHIEDVNQYMSLDEIKEFLLDDPELSDEERFDLYYSEHRREQRRKERRRLERGAKPIDEIMKELGLTFSDGSHSLNKKNDKKK